MAECCTLTQDDLKEIIAAYHVHPDKLPLLPEPNQFIHEPPAGYAGVYLHHLKAGLRFPPHDFIKAVLVHYKVHLIQIAPNGFRKMMCFLLICKLLDISPTVDLFRHFYAASPSGDWLSFSKRKDAVELCLGLPSSIKNWKGEFFFVKSSAYPAGVAMGNMGTRPSDRAQRLSLEEHSLVDRISPSVLWWKDPDERTLALAGLSPYWDSLDPKPLFTIEGREMTLSDCVVLFRDMKTSEAIGISSGAASSSSLDSTAKPAQGEGSLMDPPKTTSAPTVTMSTKSSRKRPLTKSLTLKEGGASSSPLETPSHTNVADSDEEVPKRHRVSDEDKNTLTNPSSEVPESRPLETLVECDVTADPLLDQAPASPKVTVVFAPARLTIPPPPAKDEGLKDAEASGDANVLTQSHSPTTSLDGVTGPLPKPKSSQSVFHESLFGSGAEKPPPLVIPTPSSTVATDAAPKAETPLTAGISGTILASLLS